MKLTRLHIIPIGDELHGKLKLHAASRECWCHPTEKDDVVTHNAFDCREKQERHGVPTGKVWAHVLEDKQPGEVTNTHSSASPENERYLWRELETARFEREKARHMLKIRSQALEQLRVGIANEEEHGLWEADTILSIIDEALTAEELQRP